MTPNRYRLIRTIASGGMAHVYEAVAQGDAGFERRVALKRILPELAHLEGAKRMFLDEARIASHLHHGNIVQVLDYGSVDETEFIAMEYVDGVDAHRAVSQSRQQGVALPDVLALHIVSEVAHALAYAHDRKDHDGRPLSIVHRDVSPQNLLLSWDGDVKLADFGIAKAATRFEKTSTGIVKGKVSYMAPEQAMGASVGPGADVYALGATLHALITGAPPKADEQPPEMSPDIAALIGSCMKHDAGDRPTAAEVALEAGRLATQRLDRDARGALATWLTPLRGGGTVSALDDLMGVFLTSSSDDGDRRFTVERMAVTRSARGDGSDRGSAPAPPAAAGVRV
ncbi:MAG: serine/threonine protein kinase, partial [Deltaproteobacteria bacterium]|nr:serine/threonine protein kinase [Deltaproteobacteria bacterium]